VPAWSQAYRDDGLVVIGVHTPEFSFEHGVDGVGRAAAERDIDSPVAVDNDYAIWSAFDNRYWPARSWVGSARIPNLIHFNRLEKGGHFAAWQQPDCSRRSSAPPSGRCARRPCSRVCTRSSQVSAQTRDLHTPRASPGGRRPGPAPGPR
jgi:hypothetical protein